MPRRYAPRRALGHTHRPNLPPPADVLALARKIRTEGPQPLEALTFAEQVASGERAWFEWSGGRYRLTAYGEQELERLK